MNPDWPEWAKHAQLEMDTLKLEYGVILTKVMLIATAPKVFEGPNYDAAGVVKRGSRNYELYVVGSWLGTTPEMAAYRWAKIEHKELLKSP